MLQQNQQQRSFIELYNKFQTVYDRLTYGRREMKKFLELLQTMQHADERYSKDIDSSLRKQPSNPLVNSSLTNMYTQVKNSLTSTYKFHHSVAAPTYKDLCQQLHVIINEIKSTKTKLLDQYTRLVKEVEQKKAVHAKIKKIYNDSVEKAENAVANFRSGRSQVGNEKQIKKLEEAMHSASKELEKNHIAYLKAVRDCQLTQKKYEENTENYLIQFEDLEKKRLTTYQAIMNQVVDVHSQYKQDFIARVDGLDVAMRNINPQQDLLQFILEVYDGKPLDAHVYYEPKNSDVIPHYGDVGVSQESQEHVIKTLQNHSRLMTNSTMKPHHNYNTPVVPVTNQTNTLAVTQPASSTNNQPQITTVPVVIPTVSAQPSPPSDKVQYCSTALYNFMGQEPGDLTFDAGQTIELIQHVDGDDWWFGSINGISGAFPKTYVSPPFEISPPKGAKIGEDIHPTVLKYVIAMNEFTPENDDELALKIGNVYSVYGIIEDWYEGALFENGKHIKKGIFPISFTKDQ